jgi:hypothetical protein
MVYQIYQCPLCGAYHVELFNGKLTRECPHDDVKMEEVGLVSQATLDRWVESYKEMMGE